MRGAGAIFSQNPDISYRHLEHPAVCRLHTVINGKKKHPLCLSQWKTHSEPFHSGMLQGIPKDDKKMSNKFTRSNNGGNNVDLITLPSARAAYSNCIYCCQCLNNCYRTQRTTSHTGHVSSESYFNRKSTTSTTGEDDNSQNLKLNLDFLSYLTLLQKTRQEGRNGNLQENP